MCRTDGLLAMKLSAWMVLMALCSAILLARRAMTCSRRTLLLQLGLATAGPRLRPMLPTDMLRLVNLPVTVVSMFGPLRTRNCMVNVVWSVSTGVPGSLRHTGTDGLA